MSHQPISFTLFNIAMFVFKGYHAHYCCTYRFLSFFFLFLPNRILSLVIRLDPGIFHPDSLAWVLRKSKLTGVFWGGHASRRKEHERRHRKHQNKCFFREFRAVSEYDGLLFILISRLQTQLPRLVLITPHWGTADT